MALSPECVLQSHDGTRVAVDLLSQRSCSRPEATSSFLQSQDGATALELRRFHFPKQFTRSHDHELDRLLTSQITSLVLEDCVLSDRIVALLVERLITTTTKLHSLVVRRCRQLTMTSLLALASLVTASATSLATLELSSCHLARQAGILLGQALQTCRVLQRVDVSGNNLRDGGLKAIADGLRLALAAVAAVALLPELDVSGNGVSSTGLASLVALPLQRLLASDNAITTLPASLFTGNLQLESLRVSNNPISEHGMRELLTMALQAPQLRSLAIQNCGFSIDNQAFLTTSLLHRATGTATKTSTKRCALQHVFVGESPSLLLANSTSDERLDDSDGEEEEEEEEEATESRLQTRFLDCKRTLEARVPGLLVHLLDPTASTTSTSSTATTTGGGGYDDDDDDDDSDGNADDDDGALLMQSPAVSRPFGELEVETPGRQVRRELLERTEFMRRHSEELPLSDGENESLASFVSDKLLRIPNSDPPAGVGRRASYNTTKPQQSLPQQQQRPRPAPLLARHSQSLSSTTVDADNDQQQQLLLLPDSPLSRRTSAAGSCLHQSHHSHHHFCPSTTLDDVASQFSIDPPASVSLTSACHGGYGGGNTTSGNGSVASAITAALQSTDVEYIVSRTIDTMNRNFEQRLSQFLLRMEFQQQEKHASQLQSLAAKVEACERAIPRLEARLDVLADRIATSGAQVVKLQNDWQNSSSSSSTTTKPQGMISAGGGGGGGELGGGGGAQWSSVLQSHVEEIVTSRLRVSESHTQSELLALRRDIHSVAMATQTSQPQAIVDAVSVHLTQFKQEFDANQTTVLRRFTENIAQDGYRVDERMQQLEGKVAHLEGIIQAEQHASLLALEAISEAFTGNNATTTSTTSTTTTTPPSPSPSPVAPLPRHYPQPQPQHYASSSQQPRGPQQPQHGYTFTTRPLK